jgi:hypothetical protein
MLMVFVMRRAMLAAIAKTNVISHTTLAQLESLQWDQHGQQLARGMEQEEHGAVLSRLSRPARRASVYLRATARVFSRRRM